MKLQDLVFFAITIIMLLSRRFQVFVAAGIVFLALAMPLFALHIFFTAERLTWYAAFYFFIAALYLLIKNNMSK